MTGANYLLESADSKILIDCGLHQGGRYAEEENYKAFPYNPGEISAVFITHAHIDHIGLLPRLVKEGFKGTVHSTKPTKEFAQFLLEDALNLMEHENGHFAERPLYNKSHIDAVMRQWEGHDYHEAVSTGPFSVVFYNAGHILGSASFLVEAEGKRVLFSGDLGNMPAPLIKPTEYIEKTDYCLIESTYGDRLHSSSDRIKDQLEDAVEDVVKSGGVLMIPAFAMERTQDLLFHLNELAEQGRTPRVPIYMDSPLAIHLTEAYEKFTDYLNEETRTYIKKGKKLFQFPNLHKTPTVEESKRINETPAPKIIIAGSGMSNGGRILHHERRYLSDPKSALLFVGYQAKGSLGRLILDGAEFVKMFGETIPVRCKKVMIDAYSAHADSAQLLKWLEPMRLSLKRCFVVQGEEDQAEPFAQRVRDELGFDADVAKPGETVEL